MNSQNSSKPPSSDSPFKKSAATREPKEKKKPGAKKGHQGHRQALLNPGETMIVKPAPCTCGNSEFPETTRFHTHQVIELPEIQMEVTHLFLHRGNCPCCGKLNKAVIPTDQRTGQGPQFSSLVAEMSGIFSGTASEKGKRWVQRIRP